MINRHATLRTGPVALAAVTAVTVALTLAPPATAGAATPAPATANSAPPAPQTVTLDGVAPGDHAVTLLSGDRVTLVDLGGGEYRIDVTPVPRADGSLPPAMDINVRPDGAYVVPADAQAGIAAGTLDRELFNVAALAEYGYTDAAVDALPVIVQRPEPGAARSPAAVLPGSEQTRGLPVLDAAAVSVPKADAARAWEAVQVDPLGPDLASGAASLPGSPRIWLDRMYEVALADSVPQVGAPEAWDAGHDGTGATVAVLDTGVDADHPDLAGRIAAAESFVRGAADVADGHGHGTHVAATVGGTGAASDGLRRGVAPGADLLIGKVCADSGSCRATSILAGMAWATDQGADVVSMSLGSPRASDGTDVLSQAVNRLTEQTGSLFVIGAGNNRLDFSISSPGAADAALTVGAVTKGDELARFSSRGPRGPELLGDYAIKPEIAAPGVSIVAARSATGTDMGGGAEPVGEHYLRASGTSMATPHVAGAAAILAAQRPELGPDELKATLVSTAEDAGYTVYQQGGGRLDLARAVRQQVRVTPAVADFRAVQANETPRPQTLTYTNPTGQDVTLDLTAALADTSGGDPADISLSSPRVTVPAGGDAAVTVTVGDPALATYSGRVTATAPDGVRLTTPVGLAVLPPVHRLELRVARHADDTCRPIPCHPDSFSVWGVDGPGIGHADRAFGERRDPSRERGYHAFTVPEGTYMLRARYVWQVDGERRFGYLVLPEVEVTSDKEVVFDANDAVPVAAETPLPSQRYRSQVHFCRTDATGFTTGCSLVWTAYPWALPSEPVTVGSYRFAADWVLGPPLVSMVTTGPDPLDLRPLSPVYLDGLAVGAVARFPAGTRRLPVVDVGAGEEEDYQGVDVRGALAFTSASCAVRERTAHQAEAAGAVGVLIPVLPGCRLLRDPGNLSDTVPVAQIPPAQTTALIDRLAAGPVTVTTTGHPEPEYLYRLTGHEPEGVPADPTYRFTAAEMATVDHHLHAAEPARVSLTLLNYFAADSFLPGVPSLDVQAPATIRVYTAPAAPEVPLTYGSLVVAGDQRGLRCSFGNLAVPACEQAVDALPGPGGYDQVHWNVDPTVVGAPAQLAGTTAITTPALCAGCRQGDTLVALTNLTTAQPGHWRGKVDAADSETRLFRDGEEVPATPLTITEAPYQGTVNTYQLPEQEAEYRLTQRVGPIDTTWWFRSQEVTTDRTPPETVCAATFQDGLDTPCEAEPLIFLRYDAGVDVSNSVPAPGAHRLRVHAYHQDPTGPEIAGVRVWFSTDGGDRWHRARTLGPVRDGELRALVVAPPLRRTDGTVSLRVEAWDADGNRVTQTVRDAYGLAPRTPASPSHLAH